MFALPLCFLKVVLHYIPLLFNIRLYWTVELSHVDLILICFPLYVCIYIYKYTSYEVYDFWRFGDQPSKKQQPWDWRFISGLRDHKWCWNSGNQQMLPGSWFVCKHEAQRFYDWMLERINRLHELGKWTECDRFLRSWHSSEQHDVSGWRREKPKRSCFVNFYWQENIGKHTKDLNLVTARNGGVTSHFSWQNYTICFFCWKRRNRDEALSEMPHLVRPVANKAPIIL